MRGDIHYCAEDHASHILQILGGINIPVIKQMYRICMISGKRLGWSEGFPCLGHSTFPQPAIACHWKWVTEEPYLDHLVAISELGWGESIFPVLVAIFKLSWSCRLVWKVIYEWKPGSMLKTGVVDYHHFHTWWRWLSYQTLLKSHISLT